jgi:hypothetical protein
MTAKFVRAPNRPVLVGAALAFLLFAAWGVQNAAATVVALNYRMPLWILAAGAIRDAIFGIALLYVALRKSQFAGATAVVIATFLIFGIALDAFASVAFGLAFHIGWGKVETVAIAGAILWPSVFPWSRSANKPVLFWMALTFGLLTLLMGSAMILVRL